MRSISSGGQPWRVETVTDRDTRGEMACDVGRVYRREELRSARPRCIPGTRAVLEASIMPSM